MAARHVTCVCLLCAISIVCSLHVSAAERLPLWGPTDQHVPPPTDPLPSVRHRQHHPDTNNRHQRHGGVGGSAKPRSPGQVAMYADLNGLDYNYFEEYDQEHMPNSISKESERKGHVEHPENPATDVDYGHSGDYISKENFIESHRSIDAPVVYTTEGTRHIGQWVHTTEGPRLLVHPISHEDILTKRPRNTEEIPVQEPPHANNKEKEPLPQLYTFIMPEAGKVGRTEMAPLSGVRALSDEERLLRYLFTGYNPSARPVINSSQTVPVQIMFSLMHIKDLDIRSQIFTTTGLLILEWTDERLKWNPAEHNNMSEVIVEARSMWRPEFAVINGADKIYEDYNQFRAMITHEGIVHWEPGGVFKTMCEIDITYYPFDEQRCDLMFGAWSYDTTKMNLTNTSHIVNLDSYKGNGEWEVFFTEAHRNEFFYDANPTERFSNVAFELHLRRRHTFYILNVILPSIMTSILLLSIFFCTPGQKVQIGVVVLLSFRIFLLNVADNIPKTSDHIPLLGIYLTCTMAITTLSMVLTVFVLNLHHITEKPVPIWLKRFIFIYVARMLGMCDTANEALREDQRQTQFRKMGSFFRRSSLLAGGDSVAAGDAEERVAMFELQNRSPASPGMPAANTNGVPETGSMVTINSRKVPPPPPPMMIAERKEKESEEDKPAKENYGRDWVRLAEIFDRLFFWLFLLAIFISTLVLFHPLTKSYINNTGK